MSQHLKTLFRFTLILGLCGAFLRAAFHGVDRHEIWTAIQGAELLWIALTALLLVLVNIPRAWRWRVLIAPVTQDISTWRMFTAILVGYAGNNIFPRAGEVARVVALKRGKDVSTSALLATVVVERIIDMLAVLLLFGIVLFAFRSKIARAFPGMEGVSLVAFVVTILLLLLLGALSVYGHRSLGVLQHILSHISPSLARPTLNVLRAFLQGIESVRTATGYLKIIVLTLSINAFYVLTVYLPFLSFRFPERYGLDLPAALVVLVISTIGIILPSFGGIGTYHYFCSQALHRIYNVPIDQALAFATLAHGIAYFTFLLAGGPGLLGLFRGQKRGSGAPDSQPKG